LQRVIDGGIEIAFADAGEGRGVSGANRGREGGGRDAGGDEALLDRRGVVGPLDRADVQRGSPLGGQERDPERE